MFENRTEAGQQLALALERFRTMDPLVLALARGGVVVGAEVARILGCALDVLLVKKLRAPGSPELAIGAVGEEGRACLNDEIARLTGADDSYVQAEITNRLAEIAGQHAMYRAIKPKIAATGRVTILVDDGLATGATMIAAAQITRRAEPERVVVAVPVGAPATVRELEAMDEVDEVICLLTPDWFEGVGQFYGDFTQVSDEEVTKILQELA
jgi:putative phosphoribosyl transferase